MVGWRHQIEAEEIADRSLRAGNACVVTMYSVHEQPQGGAMCMQGARAGPALRTLLDSRMGSRLELQLL
jgi:hypothetical protein